MLIMNILLPIICFLLLFNSNSLAATITWTGSGDGSSWSDGDNWSSSSVPASTDDITIDCSCTVNSSSNFEIKGSLTINSGTTVNSTGKFTLKADDATLTNHGTLIADEIKAEEFEDTSINNYGDITTTKLEDKHVPNASTFNNYSGALITVTEKIHFHGTINNIGTIDGSDIDEDDGGGQKIEIHGATVTGGGTLIGDNIVIKKEGTEYAYIESQSFTSGNSCAGGSSVTFNDSDYSSVSGATGPIDGFSFHQDDVYVCNFNANGLELPVELISFYATLKGEEVIVEWETASEQNNSHFIIERSKDGKYWDMLGRVEGAGNSNINLSYEFTDDAPLNGNSKYRLLQIDFDGSYEYFSPVTVNRNIENKILAYPIPAQDIINIQGIEEDNFSIFSSSGKEVSTEIQSLKNSTNTISINLTLLPNGLYILKHKNQVIRFYKY